MSKKKKKLSGGIEKNLGGGRDWRQGRLKGENETVQEQQMKPTEWREKGRLRWQGSAQEEEEEREKEKEEEEGRKDKGMEDEGVECEGSVQEGGFGWQASLNALLFFPLLASLLMQNRPYQPCSHPSYNRKTMADPLRDLH